MNAATHASPYVLEALLAIRPVEHRLVQGSPEWEAHRSSPTLRNASEVGAMLSCDPHATREQLLQAYALSVRGEPSDYKQGIYDSGHRFEGLARPIAEEIIGEELYPRVLTRGPLGASYDGTTLAKDLNWEHKRLNDELRQALPFPGPEGVEKNRGDDLPKRHRGQMEQQMIVDGAERCLFSATHWEVNKTTGEWELKDARHCWYESDPRLREEVLRGWAQFDEDLAEYKPQPAAMKAVAGPIEDLPLLVINIEGRVTESNLESWRDAMVARIKAINRDLKTDEDFATAKAMVTKLEDGKKVLQLRKEQALAQASEVLATFKAIDAISDTMDETRKALDALVKEREVAIRDEIKNEGVVALRRHLQRLNERLAEYFGGQHVMPEMTHARIAADFAKAMKNRRTLKTLREAVNAELARAKIAATGLADDFEANGKVLVANNEHKHLFADWRTLIFKAPDDCALVVKTRISEHLAEQERKRQADDAEAEAKRQQRESDAQQTPQQQPGPAVSVPSPSPSPVYVGGGGYIGSGWGGSRRGAAPARTPAPTQAAGSTVYLTLAQINSQLAPLSVHEAGLESLGLSASFLPDDPFHEPRYPQALLTTIVDVLLGHLAHVRESLAAPAAAAA